MAQTNKVGAHKTRIYTDDAGYTCVLYHSTNVVKYNNDYIILNTGGYYSNTTKLRMNQASNQFGLGYKVYQKNYEWYVDYGGHTFHFDKNRIVLMTDDDGKGYQLVYVSDNFGEPILPKDTGMNHHARMDGVNQEYNDWRLGNDEEEAF